METAKDSNSYYLDEANIQWLSKKAEKEKRSASWYLNEIITKIRKNTKSD